MQNHQSIHILIGQIACRHIMTPRKKIRYKNGMLTVWCWGWNELVKVFNTKIVQFRAGPFYMGLITHKILWWLENFNFKMAC